MRTRYVAAVSLGVMGAGFIATKYLLPDAGWVRLLESGFEAGLVGGFADWFAVTALFRHPLGIPIPHTSLLLKNRNKIVNALISAMENELLNKESISRKLSHLKLFSGLASGAVRLIGKRKTRSSLISFAQAALERLPLERLSGMIREFIADYVRKQDIRPIVRKLTDKFANDGWDEKALDYLLGAGKQWVSKRETEQMLGKFAFSKLEELQVGGLMGFAVQAFIGFMSPEKLGPMVQGMLLSAIRDLSQPGSANRTKLLHEVKAMIEQLPDNEPLMDQWKSALENGAESIELERFIHLRLEELRQLLLDKLEEEQRNGGRFIVKSARYLADRAEENTALLEQWEKAILDYGVGLLERNHYRIGMLVRDNLDQMDDKALVEMLEQKIGNDLQWIRVNGAICGFVVGVVLSFF
ncbi:DUF445 domain-containing protein [Paenibacillus sp. NEAU-GSW1]|uniref:DUF445 domain-containing protein n=1 Tax=Paenibacillus sp. NEAU-GSW1 TaxID=2682486 RepID=UPI0012E26ABD|nr:DUF445 domain-containing protein [Paenibacillus sp. NEAU-GSW1]MUT67156.1 DUF445 family protein [Paenibacillus sp. NEAU-GSW1]